jgi:hypothetical protein
MRRARLWSCAQLAAVTLMVTACAAAGGGSGSAPTPQSPPAVGSAVPVSSVSDLGPASSPTPDAQAVIAAVQQAAADQVGISPAEVHVEQVEAHQWGDSSLGCPRPGLLYSQVVTDGFLIVVTAADKTLEYHSDARGRVVLCQVR